MGVSCDIFMIFTSRHQTLLLLPAFPKAMELMESPEVVFGLFGCGHAAGAEPCILNADKAKRSCNVRGYAWVSLGKATAGMIRRWLTVSWARVGHDEC